MLTFRTLQRRLFLLLLIIITVVFFWMIRSYLLPVFWAVVLAILFARVQERLVRETRGRRGLSAALTLALIFVIVVVPLAILGSLVVDQAVELIKKLDVDGDSLTAGLNGIEEQMPLEWLEDVGIARERVHEAVVNLVRNIGEIVLARAGALGASTLRFVVNLLIMLYVLYEFLKDGDRILEVLVRYVPFDDERERRLFRRFASTSRATIKGTFVVAIVQGFLGAVLFWAVGITSPALWGTLMALLSVIPALGTAAVWAPAGIILWLSGDIGRAIIVLLVGGVVISSVDNFLRPALVGKDTKMPDVLILVSTLGGMSAFGVSGFVIGPIFASFFVAMWQMFEQDFKADFTRDA
jgi:predicted PurR-regulated permease PerM